MSSMLKQQAKAIQRALNSSGVYLNAKYSIVIHFCAHSEISFFNIGDL